MIPLGGRNDPVNEAGIQWYSNLIDGLLERGIVPFAVRDLVRFLFNAPLLITRGLSPLDFVPLGSPPSSLRALRRVA